jgi:hypothetical protein
MRNTIIVLAAVGAFSLSAVAAPNPAEARARAYTGTTGLATFAYGWVPDYNYYRSSYYSNYVPSSYDRYVYDNALLARYSCCGYTTTTFYNDDSGFRRANAGRPALVYIGVPYRRLNHRWHRYR